MSEWCEAMDRHCGWVCTTTSTTVSNENGTIYLMTQCSIHWALHNNRNAEREYFIVHFVDAPQSQQCKLERMSYRENVTNQTENGLKRERDIIATTNEKWFFLSYRLFFSFSLANRLLFSVFSYEYAVDWGKITRFIHVIYVHICIGSALEQLDHGHWGEYAFMSLSMVNILSS